MQIIGTLFVLLLLSSGSFLGASRFGKRYEELLPVTLMVIIVILFFFYIINSILIGFWLILTLALACYVYSLIHIIKTKIIRETMERFLTPAAAVWLILFIAAYALTKGSAVQLWDELRLWGALPKAMYETNHAQLGAGSLLYPGMRNYPPGMALLQYFWARATGRFSDNQLFLTHSLFGLSLFMPFFKTLRWKDWLLLPVLAIIVFFTPLLLYNSNNDSCYFYTSLYIDPDIALLFAFGMFFVLVNRMEGAYALATLSLTASVMILLKDNGVLFAVILFCTAFAVNRKTSVPPAESVAIPGRKRRLRILLALIAPVLVFAAWKLALAAWSVDSVPFLGLLALPGQRKYEIAAEFLRALLVKPIVESNSEHLNPLLTYASLMSFITAFTVLFSVFMRKEYRKRFIVISVGMYLCNTAYIAGMLLLYAYQLGMALPSFARYVCVPLSAHVSFLVLNVLQLWDSEADSRFGNRRRFAQAAALFTAAAVILFPVRQPHNRLTSQAARQAALGQAKRISSALANRPGYSSVYLVIGGSERGNSLYHHHIYYALLDDGIFIKNFWKETDVAVPAGASQADIEKAYRKWNDMLVAGGYDYVYLANDNPGFVKQFAPMCRDTIEKETLYRVNIHKGQVELTRVK